VICKGAVIKEIGSPVTIQIGFKARIVLQPLATEGLKVVEIHYTDRPDFYDNVPVKVRKLDNQLVVFAIYFVTVNNSAASTRCISFYGIITIIEAVQNEIHIIESPIGCLAKLAANVVNPDIGMVITG